MCSFATGLRSVLTLSLLWAAVACSAARADGLTLHVAPNGNDAWSGRLAAPESGDGPFRTLQRARDEIRKIKKAGSLPVGGIVVELRGGSYEMATPLELSADDSGAASAPIEWRARSGEEVRISGGLRIDNFRPVTDPAALKRLDASARGKALQADLRAAGVKDLGQVAGDNRLELFFQDKPMTLARWPNAEFVHIVDVVGGKLVDVRGTVGDAIGKFTYKGDRPNRWVGEKDIWLHGYWFWDWSDGREQVESIDTGRRLISLVPPYHNYGYRKGQWYYAFNLLPELDTPGEWYLDRTSGVLYFWPPAPIEPGKTVVSIIPNLVNMNKVSHVTLRGLIFEACRATAVVAREASHVQIVGCTIRNTGSWGVELSGSQSAVAGCDICDTANGGIAMDGGDRATLSPAALVADNNHIHHYGRWNPMYQSAIRINGVGHRVTHNLIHDAPHMAINFGGNDHLIEFNEIHDVCRESNDAGAIYAGRDWTMRGTVIRYNYFHDISGFRGNGCVGVYLDDQFSGAEIRGNLFYKVTRAAMIGGGRDCEIVNNVFVDCTPATHVDARGLNWAAPSRDTMDKSLAAVPYKNSLWASRYPKLAHILDENPMAPVGNRIARNICLRGRWGDFEAAAKPMVAFQDNLIDQDPRFVDPAHENFQLKDDSPAYKLGFQRLPLEKIGLYQSPQRSSWPVRPAVQPTGSSSK
jgi:hypothetical protein